MDQSPTDPDLPNSAQGEPSRLDLVTAESEEELEGWSRKERQLFAELVEDAPSDLQRELLRRALAAGHRSYELHAFGDAIRGLPDRDVFATCTLAPEKAVGHSMEERLLAEADPIYAYELNGGGLTPQATRAPPPVRLPPGMIVDSVSSPSLPRLRELGTSPEASTGSTAARRPEGPVVEGRFAEELFNEVLRPLGFTFTERAVDGAGMTLDAALAGATEALASGLPVPVVLGAREGDYRRYALILQLQHSGNRRVFEVHDPFVHETVWIHEGDFQARKELPFSDKTLRRITAIALPSGAKR